MLAQSSQPAMPTPTYREVPFVTGNLSVRVERQIWPLDVLCGFAVRNNPRRGYLVVSKVLGRHIPTSPGTMRATFRHLAMRIPTDLPGPVLFVGVAEMGICLAQGVYEEYCRISQRHDVVFIHTTRHTLDRPLLATFVEPHSHAPWHYVYVPDQDEILRTVLAAQSLVLVDDEASTGTTFVNLAASLLSQLSRVETVVTAVLTDWSEQSYLATIARPALAVSLLSGSLSWKPRTNQGPFPSTNTPSPQRTTRELPNFGRLGRADPSMEADQWANDVDLMAGSVVRIIGTGEFTFPPFRIAEVLESRGYQVDVQATSRSPAMVGGLIQSVLSFEDNYKEGVSHFLYNQNPEDAGRRSIIYAETPASWVDKNLVRAIDARVMSLGPC